MPTAFDPSGPPPRTPKTWLDRLHESSQESVITIPDSPESPTSPQEAPRETPEVPAEKPKKGKKSVSFAPQIDDGGAAPASAAAPFAFSVGRKSLPTSGNKRKAPSQADAPSKPPPKGAAPDGKKSRTKPARNDPCCFCPATNQCFASGCPCAKVGRPCSSCSPGDCSRCRNQPRHRARFLQSKDRLKTPRLQQHIAKKAAQTAADAKAVQTTAAATGPSAAPPQGDSTLHAFWASKKPSGDAPHPPPHPPAAHRPASAGSGALGKTPEEDPVAADPTPSP